MLKKLFTKNDMNGVKQSLIASLIFLILLEPIIQIGKNLSKGIIASFVDYFYYSCSRVNGISFVSYLVFIAFAFYLARELRELTKLYRELFLSNRKEEAKDSENSSKVEQHCLNNTRETADETQEKVLKVTGGFVIVLNILLLCYILTYWYLPSAMNTSFDRRIIQITPYVESEEIDLLKSDWASMESKDDYDKIAEKIDFILATNGLK